MNKQLFTAIATLTGTIIGAGFLGIPYVVAKSGFLLGFFWMALIAIIMLIVNLTLGEIILSTKTLHQIPGYASKYLGRKTKIFVFIASIIGFYAALVAYLLGEGESLSFLITGTTSYALYIGIGFWILVAIISIKGIRSFKKIEPLAVIAVFIVTIILGFISFKQINLSNLTSANFSFLFYPFGVVLFAFLGTSAIPEMRRILKKNQKLLKKAIIIGSLVPLLVYTLFVIVVLGLHGTAIEQIATISLGKTVTLLGIFTMFTAFLALTLALQDTYRFDFSFSFKKAWLLSTLLPLILFAIIKTFNLAGFVKILSLGGAISGGLLSIAILLIHEKLKSKKIIKKLDRKPEYKINIPLILKIIFILIFIIGIIYEFI